MTTTIERALDEPRVGAEGKPQRVGGLAAFYLALALLAAIPYFLLVVDYPGATTAADKVALIAEHYSSMYVMYLATYVFFGIAIGVLALSLWGQAPICAPATVRIATGIGLLWSFALVASGMVFMYGMTTVEPLVATDHVQAVTTWQAVEPVAMALGGAGGELLGGLWVLLISLVVLRGGGLPKAFGWLGLLIGMVGLVSVVPPLKDAALAFGMLQLVWFVWLGVALLKTPVSSDRPVTGR